MAGEGWGGALLLAPLREPQGAGGGGVGGGGKRDQCGGGREEGGGGCYFPLAENPKGLRSEGRGGRVKGTRQQREEGEPRWWWWWWLGGGGSAVGSECRWVRGAHERQRAWAPLSVASSP